MAKDNLETKKDVDIKFGSKNLMSFGGSSARNDNSCGDNEVTIDRLKKECDRVISIFNSEIEVFKEQVNHNNERFIELANKKASID